MGSVRAIAKSVGVSPATVSRAINNDPRVTEKVRKKVLAAMNRSRYVPAVGRRSTTNIALAYAGQTSLGSPFDAAIMQGMSRPMEECGFDLLILHVRSATLPHETYSQMFVRKGVRGAILRSDTHSRAVCEAVAQEGFPAIVVGDRFENPKVSYICSNSLGASQDAIEHLIGLGHERIAVSVNVVDDSDHADRVDGWRAAMVRHGLVVDERLILRAPANREGGAQLLRRIASMADRPTAVYVADPMAAVGCLNEALASGLRVPGDLSIVGFDDAELSSIVRPKMTMVRQDAVAIGRDAFDALHAMLEEKGALTPVRRALDAWLEVHDSTAPPPGRG